MIIRVADDIRIYPPNIYKQHSGVTDMELRNRWISFLHKLATGTKITRSLLTPIGVVIFGVITTLFVLVALFVDKLLGLSCFLPEAVRVLISIPLMVVGMAVTVWSAFHFVKAKGTPVPINPPPKVVDTGPYHYTRNPMLTGVFLFLFGVGFSVNSYSLVFIFTPVYILIHVWELKKIEEPELMKRLGDEYTEYRKRTPMFIPNLRILTKEKSI
jgi:protein-S-isoprenylcysteine O-methyltransferase Ste14